MTWEGTPLDPPRPTEVLQVGGSARFKRAGHPSRFFGFRIRLEPSILLERPVKFDQSDRTFYRPDFTGPTPTRCRPHGPPGAPARRQTRRTRCGIPIGVTRGSPRPGRHRAGEPRLIPRIRANEQPRRINQQPPRRRSGLGGSAKSPPRRRGVPRLAGTPWPPPRPALQAMPGVAQPEEGQLCTLLQAWQPPPSHTSPISSMPAAGPAMPAVQPSLVVLTTADPPTSKLQPSTSLCPFKTQPEDNKVESCIPLSTGVAWAAKPASDPAPPPTQVVNTTTHQMPLKLAQLAPPTLLTGPHI